MQTIVILVLALILIIGIVRFTKEKNQTASSEESGKNQDSPKVEVKSDSETPFQTTQEMDSSYYSEAYTPKVEEKVSTQEKPKSIRKSPAPKKTETKKESSKKGSAKKPATKKAPTKKSK